MLACCLPNVTASELNEELSNILSHHGAFDQIILHVGTNDILRGESEILKRNFNELFNKIEKLSTQKFISGPLPAREPNMFLRHLNLNTWLSRTCTLKCLNYINYFN